MRLHSSYCCSVWGYLSQCLRLRSVFAKCLFLFWDRNMVFITTKFVFGGLLWQWQPSVMEITSREQPLEEQLRLFLRCGEWLLWVWWLLLWTHLWGLRKGKKRPFTWSKPWIIRTTWWKELRILFLRYTWPINSIVRAMLDFEALNWLIGSIQLQKASRNSGSVGKSWIPIWWSALFMMFWSQTTIFFVSRWRILWRVRKIFWCEHRNCWEK